MANFCTRCGRTLSEGEVCNCQNNGGNMVQDDYNQILQAKQTEPVFTAEKGKMVFDNVKVNFIDLLKKPADAARSFVVKGDIALASILIVLQGLISAVFAMILCLKFNSALSDSYSGEDIDSYTKKILEKMELPTAGNFFRTWIYSILLSVILAGVIFIILKIVGLELNIKNILCIAATKCVPIITLDVLACVICLISEDIGIGLFLISGLIGLVYVICTFNLSVSIEDNKKVFLIVAMVTVFVIILAILVKCTYTSYLSENVQKMFEQIGKQFGAE